MWMQFIDDDELCERCSDFLYEAQSAGPFNLADEDDLLMVERIIDALSVLQHLYNCELICGRLDRGGVSELVDEHG